MKVTVTDHNTDKQILLEGSCDYVKSALLFRFPFLRDQGKDHPLEDLLEKLDSTAYFAVDVEGLDSNDEELDNHLIESEMDDGE